MVPPEELQEVRHRDQDARADAARVELLLADELVQSPATMESICAASERPTNNRSPVGMVARLGGLRCVTFGRLHLMRWTSSMSGLR